MGRVLTRGSIRGGQGREGKGERWEDRAERHDEIWLPFPCMFITPFLVFLIVFVSGWIRYIINVILEERIYFSDVHVINVLLSSEYKNKGYILLLWFYKYSTSCVLIVLIAVLLKFMLKIVY